MDCIISIEEFQSLNADAYILIEAGCDRQAFEKEHLEKAIYLDLDDDLAQIPTDAKNGGRHPLPLITDFAKKMQNIGVQRDARVIIYDRNFGANSAARCWWMLKSIGVENVSVLSGGFQYAKNHGYPTTDAIMHPKPSNSSFSDKWLFPTVDKYQVEKFIKTKEKNILDVRSPERYQGISEPIDPIAGHVPTAQNVFFKENLTEEGLFKSKADLKKMYEGKGKLVVHCGSGVTACHTILSMAYAGLEIPSLYVGSWSEWCRI